MQCQLARYVLQWGVALVGIMSVAAAFAQSYREVGRQSRIVQTDTTQQADTLTVVQLVEVRQQLVRAAPPPAFIYEIRPGLSIVQAAFSNWVGGGVNALAWSSNLNVRVQYRQDAWFWEARAVAEFGQTLVDGAFRKTNDLLDLQTFAKLDLGASFGPQFAASLRTQFADGFDFSRSGAPQISGFFDPAYSVQSLGLAYARSDSLRASMGIAAREIFTNQFPNFADDPNTEDIERINIRAGIELYIVWLVELFRSVSFRTRTQLFAPFARLGALEVNQKFTLFLNINQFLDTRFTLVLLYQENLSKRVQLQETLELTISFKISNQ
ncbi:MAG: DUF3078 domain-containing protein [Chloroherpetonaceae bacterium]|nr:DUF3078 domain-containing protein [Chloroherpetonaceae bacterium]MCS7210861.1 DUF3078 domain-containing protein [Chloroherpetonaceae bacterium]MDW8019794.1 DUF3078 domain-containing protein [Chloroherpetonaceae bacterium]MDW8466962.1 DUF3078 domain-containing protein [Chloroherpetonaceae bacterium]